MGSQQNLQKNLHWVLEDIYAFSLNSITKHMQLFLNFAAKDSYKFFWKTG